LKKLLVISEQFGFFRLSEYESKFVNNGKTLSTRLCMHFLTILISVRKRCGSVCRTMKRLFSSLTVGPRIGKGSSLHENLTYGDTQARICTLALKPIVIERKYE